MRLQLAIATSILLSLSFAAPAEAVQKTIPSNCSFALVDAGQRSEYVRVHCTEAGNPSEYVKITFRKGAGYSYVRSRVGKKLRCDVKVEQIGHQPARYGVFDCQN